jgi:hypothetical protein
MPQSVNKHKAIDVKQAWSIKNYRYVCDVSTPVVDTSVPSSAADPATEVA